MCWHPLTSSQSVMPTFLICSIVVSTRCARAMHNLGVTDRNSVGTGMPLTQSSLVCPAYTLRCVVLPDAS